MKQAGRRAKRGPSAVRHAVLMAAAAALLTGGRAWGQSPAEAAGPRSVRGLTFRDAVALALRRNP